MSPIIDFVVGEAARLLAITGHGVAGLTETAVRRLPCNLMTKRTQDE